MSKQNPTRVGDSASSGRPVASRTVVQLPNRSQAQAGRMLLGFSGIAAVIGVVGSGCLSREVVSREPSTKSSFVSAVPNTAIDKIDVLLAIDNSASMGDKQKFLAEAVPQLVSRLITPNCLDADNKVLGPATLQAGKASCAAGRPQFEAISDIHIGVLTSALGGFGGLQCSAPNGTLGKINTDRGQLIRRDSPTTNVAKIEPGNFLAWYPPASRKEGSVVPTAGYTDQTTLIKSTQDLVRGAGEVGCGLEAQLESVYHFLIAPDPWETIAVTNNTATYEGLDVALLKQRRDFLRPDSLVAVIMLTDEDDSSPDPLSIQGKGFLFTNDSAPGDPSTRKPTSACAQGFDPYGPNDKVGPNDPKCGSCIFTANKSDPNCKPEIFSASEDPANVRFFQMKRRYGIDPQYPINRYVRGFSQKRVPERAAEHDGAGNYVGDTKSSCTNPLFAKTIYDGSAPFDDKVNGGCNVAIGDRDPNLVFFAVVGGVPNELLQPAAGAESGKVTGEQWKKILGADPANFNYDGIDPRMVQSITPRTGRPAPGSPDANPADPLNTSHRDWDTKTKDLQYACTFPLPVAFQRDATADSDCAPGSDSPLCAGAAGARKQVRAKAYPTVRQFQVVKALGDQGIAASLCPQEANDKNSPLYGYTPAVATIVDRLANALSGQCLPRAATVQADGKIECLMLELLPDGITKCDAAKNKAAPDAVVEAKFRESLVAAGDKERAARTICDIGQIAVDAGTDCGTGDKPGWCYVQNKDDLKPAGRCGFKVQFQKSTLENGSTVFLQCIDQSKPAEPAPAANP